MRYKVKTMAYTDKDVKEAKDFLRTRIKAEKSATHNIEKVLIKAYADFLALCRKYGIKIEDLNKTRNIRFLKDVDELIARVKDSIYSVIEDLSLYANEDDKEHLYMFINKNVYGNTLKTRINNHVDTFHKEMVLAASMGVLAINKGIVSKGAGHSLDVLARNTIAASYMEEWKQMHPHANGFFSFRGSSYPCAICDDMVGYHPMSEYPTYASWHVNCMCFIVFDYDLNVNY